jgi:hypothetical protein
MVENMSSTRAQKRELGRAVEGAEAVEVLRKKIRGEPMSAREKAIMASNTGSVRRRTAPHSEVMAELRERRRRGA